MYAVSTKPSVDRYMQKTGVEGQGDEGQLITRADKGAFVTGFTIYSIPDERFLYGLQVAFSNGDVQSFGRTEGIAHPYGPLNNVLFTGGELGSYTHPDKTWSRAGFLKLETKGYTYLAGRPTDLSTRHTFDAGSGLLLGFNVRSGADIDSLGLVFLRPYTKFTDKFKIESLIVDSQVLDEVHYDLAKGTSAKYTYTYTETKTATVETSKSVTDTVEASIRVGTSVTAEVGTPEISPIAASLSTTVSFDATASVSNSINNTDTRSFSFEESKSTAIEINMPESDKDTRWTVAMIKFNIHAAGTCERTVTTVDGVTWTWKFPFKYSGSDKSNVIVKEKGQGDWMKADTFSA